MTGCSAIVEHDRTLAKLSKNEYVNLKILDDICQVLDCDIGDVVERIQNEGDEA